MSPQLVQRLHFKCYRGFLLFVQRQHGFVTALNFQPRGCLQADFYRISFAAVFHQIGNTQADVKDIARGNVKRSGRRKSKIAAHQRPVLRRTETAGSYGNRHYLNFAAESFGHFITICPQFAVGIQNSAPESHRLILFAGKRIKIGGQQLFGISIIAAGSLQAANQIHIGHNQIHNLRRGYPQRFFTQKIFQRIRRLIFGYLQNADVGSPKYQLGRFGRPVTDDKLISRFDDFRHTERNADAAFGFVDAERFHRIAQRRHIDFRGGYITNPGNINIGISFNVFRQDNAFIDRRLIGLKPLGGIDFVAFYRYQPVTGIRRGYPHIYRIAGIIFAAVKPDRQHRFFIGRIGTVAGAGDIIGNFIHYIAAVVNQANDIIAGFGRIQNIIGSAFGKGEIFTAYQLFLRHQLITISAVRHFYQA